MTKINQEEYESEETEVKDLEWVKAKLKKDHKDGEVAKSQIKDGEKIDGIDLNSYWRGRQTANYIARCYLEDLDEAEVLSQEWIDKHSYNVHLLGTPDVTTVAVPREDLQNLLVPKQELPVIPKWVADNIESKKRVGTRLNVAMSEFPESKLEKELDIDEHECNEIYARAWLDGYTVEEEPLYRARLKVITDEFIGSYLRTQSSNAEERLKALEIGSKYIHEDYRHLSEFTEDELKRLDIWNSRQWEVEELEE